MVKWYILMDNMLYNAQHNIAISKAKLEYPAAGNPFNATKIKLLETNLSVLIHGDSTTMLLSISNEPKLH